MKVIASYENNSIKAMIQEFPEEFLVETKGTGDRYIQAFKTLSQAQEYYFNWLQNYGISNPGNK